MTKKLPKIGVEYTKIKIEQSYDKKNPKFHVEHT